MADANHVDIVITLNRLGLIIDERIMDIVMMTTTIANIRLSNNHTALIILSLRTMNGIAMAVQCSSPMVIVNMDVVVVTGR